MSDFSLDEVDNRILSTIGIILFEKRKNGGKVKILHKLQIPYIVQVHFISRSECHQALSWPFHSTASSTTATPAGAQALCKR